MTESNVVEPTSRWVDLGGPTHYVDFGGPADGPLVVCVHGLGGSHLNWFALGPLLARRCRVLALDLAGHGRTPAAGRSAEIGFNRRLLDRFLREVSGAPAILVGNSMGGVISLMQASASPRSVAGMVLVDPALPVGRGGRPDPLVVKAFTAYAVPGIGERFLADRRRRLAPEELVQETLRMVTADPARVPAPLVDLSVQLIRDRADDVDASAKAYLQAARSLLVLTVARQRRFEHLVRTVPQPTMLIHGTKDKLVPLGAAERVAKLRPDWRFEIDPDSGHVPQLENAPWVEAKILDWLDHQGAAAATDAAHAQPPIDRPSQLAV